VIGWFPNSASLMIGPLDLSLAVIVELNTYASQSIPFPGGGRGGRQFVNLAPDGKRFIFITDDAAGDQVMNSMEIETGQISELLRLPYEEGILTNPRYSPDQSSVAYLEQSGQIDPGLTYSIRLLSTQTGQSETLAQDNLAVSVPLWSPDGRSIAFIRREGALPAPPSKDTLPQDEHTNLWVISVADQKQTQASFADGFVRSPAWEGDNQTLAYVMGDGQVELVNLAQPGKSWQAAGPSAVPELTSVFFLP
jgi:dipeptidyl aminopeptidase/acylaminoacyl peptidase